MKQSETNDSAGFELPPEVKKLIINQVKSALLRNKKALISVIALAYLSICGVSLNAHYLIKLVKYVFINL